MIELAVSLVLAVLYIVVLAIRLSKERTLTSSLKKSQKQERDAARRYGGSVNKGSGNGWVRKNDVMTDQVSMELKYTDKKSYSLKVEDLRTAEKHALLDGREMAFGISFTGESYVVIPEEYYERLYHALHTEGGL